MKPEIRRRLVRRILNSKVLAKGNLRYRDTYCPLGILCDMYKRSTGNGRWVSEGWETYDFKVKSIKGYPPSSVLEWAGMTEAESTSIYLMNDGNSSRNSKHIKEVAQFIEERFGGK